MTLWLIIILSVIMNAFYLGFRYAKRISVKRELPISEKKHLYCLGDGLTYGVGVLRERRSQAWPYLLNVSLGAGWQVLNYGIPHATVSSKDKKHSLVAQPEMQAVLENQDPLLVMIGTNDSTLGLWHPLSFEEEFKALTELLAASRLCILLTPLAVHPEKDMKTDIRGDIVVEIVAAETEFAGRSHLPMIDLHSFTLGHPEWYTGDGVHLNASGNQQVADFLYAQLKDRFPVFSE